MKMRKETLLVGMESFGLFSAGSFDCTDVVSLDDWF